MEIIKTLKQIPSLRLLIPLIVGILVNNWHSVSTVFLIIFVGCFFALSIILGFVPYFKEKIRFQKFYGISISFFFLFLGTLLVSFEDSENGLKESLPTEENTYLVTIKELPQEKNKTYKVKAELEAVIDGQYITHVKTGTILYVAKEDSFVENLVPGEKLLLCTQLKQIKNKKNPDEFDYKKFINRRGFTHTAYVEANNFRKLKLQENDGLTYKIAILRLAILNRLKAEYDEETYALLSSMLIGVKDDLDEETRDSFSASGITHLLAISGLHVGILYLVLTYLLSFMGKSNTSRVIRNGIIILILWLYAMLAGLSPSVVRATIMFSIIALGDLLSRKTIVYNSLAFAALLMLVLNPNNLFEVGFQLSFLAVLGIVYFQPRINSLIKTTNPVFSFIWGLVSVSIAAQLATFPLTIYYFHQFPNYFIIGNLIAIPLFFLNLILGLIYVALGWIPLIGVAFQILTEFLSGLILGASNFVSELRFSVTEGLSLSKLQVVFTYLLLIFFAYFLSFKRGKFLLLSQLSLLCVVMINFADVYKKSRQKELTIYNNSTRLISYIDGFHSYYFIDSVDNNKNFEYAVEEHLIKEKAFRRCEVQELTKPFDKGFLNIKTLPEGNRLVVFGKERFLFLKSNCINNKEKIYIDYIVLENDIKISVDEIIGEFEFEKIIFASSNKAWSIASWETECVALGIDFISMPDYGALQIDVNKF